MLTRTQNNALSYQATNPLVNLYFKLIDGVDYLPLVEAAWRTNQRATLVILYDLRNCRGGKGRRKLFNQCMAYLLKEDHLDPNILCHLPHYGSFKDYERIHALYPIDQVYIDIFVKYLGDDYLKTLNPRDDKVAPISLAAKYAPNNKQPFAKEIRNRLHLSAKQYRMILTTLRSHLNIVETKMCKGEWSKIDYSTVSSLAFLRYKKSFRIHDGERFNGFIESKAKINVGQLYPHQIVNQLLNNDNDANVMFDQYLDRYVGSLSNCVVVCDTSGSMMCPHDGVRPLDVAIALTLVAAWKNTGPFYRKFFEFSAKSELVEIVGANWVERVHNILGAHWGQNTNIQAVFDKLLTYSEDVQTVLVISDMQFDSCASTVNQSSTNFEVINQRYSDVGRKRPNFVFWNVSPIGSDIPVRETEKGVILVSGYSPSLFKLISESPEDVTPTSFVDTIINHPMYERIQLSSS